jgi:multimeric flavodoxin WrbA
MKVVAFNGSARKDGNTAIMIGYVFRELEKEKIKTDCAVKDDVVNDCIEKMLDADGIILGSPTYFANVSTEMKALIDRAGMVSRANSDMLARKVGAAVVAVRRAGAIHVFNSINHFFFIGQMIVPGSSYWNLGMGRQKGEVEKDDEGIQTMKNLGRNMAWLLKRIND